MTVYPNGTTDLLFSEVELAQCLAALVTPARKKRVSYHGVLAIADKLGVVVRDAEGVMHAWECIARCELLLLTAQWAVVGVGAEVRFVRWRDGEA